MNILAVCRQYTILSMLMICTGQLVLAQLGRGTISGTVTDSQGAAIVGAAISILNTDTNAEFKTATNEQGFYSAPGLAVGNYQVSGEAQGFKRVVRSGFNLQVDQSASINFSLELGNISDSVQVTGEAALVDAGDSTIGKVIEQRSVEDLPLNGRNALALVMVTPSVKSNAGPTNSGFADRGVQLSEISINGGPSSLNIITLDGGNNQNLYYGYDVTISPTVDSIQEFKVQTGTMSADIGYTAGGVVSIVSKSGTNKFHGSLYEFLRNDAIQARNAFAQTKSEFRYNQFGGALGGPVIKDKTFFFFNFEDFQYILGADPIGTMPIADWKKGDFSNLRGTNGKLITIYDPASTLPNPNGSGFIRTPFPGNIIPQERFDRVAQNLQNYYPSPDRNPSDPFTQANNYDNPSSKTRRSMRQFVIKGDHQFSVFDSLSVRYSRLHHNTTSLGLLPDPVTNSRDDHMKNESGVINYIHTFSPHLINAARASVAHQNLRFLSYSASFPYKGLDAIPEGWPAKLGFPASVPHDTFPVINITGFQSIGSGSMGIRTPTALTLADVLTYVKASHTFKFGGEISHRRSDNWQTNEPSGTFVFNSNLTGNPQAQSGTGSAYASFLLGAVSSATSTSYLGEGDAAYAFAFFLQDDWKASRKLTVNLGLRYDYQQWPQVRNHGGSNFNLNAIDPNTGLLGRMEYSGVNFGDTPYDPNRLDFSPRVGFAYDLTGKGTSVIRGGYGIYYPNTFYRDNFVQTAGFASTQTTYNPPGNNANFPAFYLQNGFPTPVITPVGAAGGPSAFLGQSVTVTPSYRPTPRSQQWNASVQRQLPGGWVFELSYIGNHGTHFVAAQVNSDLQGNAKLGGFNFNVLDPQYYALGLQLQASIPNPYSGKIPGILGGPTITRQQSLLPYPYMQGIYVTNNPIGNFISHQFIATAQRRLTHGMVVLLSYTKGKIIDDGIAGSVNFGSVEPAEGTGNSWQDGKYNRRAERGLDVLDISQRMVLSGVYELPFGNGKRFRAINGLTNTLIGGWQLNTVTTLQTGLPLAIRGANNFLADRPNSTGVSAKLDNPTTAQWFNTQAFINPPIYTYGNLAITLPDVRAPGVVNSDISIIKNTALKKEGWRLEFRAECFNAFNHTELRYPNVTFVPGPDGKNTSGAFGTITASRDPRTFQTALKFVF